MTYIFLVRIIGFEPIDLRVLIDCLTAGLYTHSYSHFVHINNYTCE